MIEEAEMSSDDSSNQGGSTSNKASYAASEWGKAGLQE